MGQVKKKQPFAETIMDEIFERNSSFHANSALQEKFDFYFYHEFFGSIEKKNIFGIKAGYQDTIL